MAVNQAETALAVVKRVSDGNRLPGNRFSSGTVLLLDATTGEVKRELNSLITPATVTFSRDGKRVVASTARRNRNRGHIYPILEQWSVETGRRENISQVPDDQAKGEDFFQGSDEEVLNLVTDCPLVCSHRVLTNGAMGVSPDRRLLLVEKPIEYGESDSTGRLRVSARYMLWDIDEQKRIATWLIPHRIHDAAILPDGRVATLNQNGTIYVMRRE